MVQRRAAPWTFSGYSPYASVAHMLQSLDSRSLEQSTPDSRLCLFYNIKYGLVAIDIPSYVVHRLRTLRNSHTLGFRHIQTTVNYCGRPWPAAYINIIQNTHQIQVLTKLYAVRMLYLFAAEQRVGYQISWVDLQRSLFTNLIFAVGHGRPLI